jgi:SepF-like predicted cell division protein (DUF552 family)
MAKSSKKALYEITVLNWEKHNSDHKKSYKKTLISNNFCTDPKLIAMPVVHRWFYLGLILLCGSNVEGNRKDIVRVSEAYLKLLCSNGVAYLKVLDSLQSFQLVTYEKIDSLKGIKEGRKEGTDEGENKNVFLGGNISKQPAKEFSNISNSTEIHHTVISKNQELSEIESTLRSENVLGTDIPPAMKSQKAMTSFCSRILISYAMSVEDFKRDLKSVINESLVDKIAPSGKSDYIVARIKKKALEVYNAAQ